MVANWSCPGSTAPHTQHDTWPLELCVARRTDTCFQIFKKQAKTGSERVNNRSPCLQNGGQLVLPGSTAPHTPHGTWPLDTPVFKFSECQPKQGAHSLITARHFCRMVANWSCLETLHTSHGTWPLELCVARRTYTCFQIFRMIAKRGSELVNNRSPCLQNGGQLVLPDSTAPHTSHGTWPLELCVARKTYTCFQVFGMLAKTGSALV